MNHKRVSLPATAFRHTSDEMSASVLLASLGRVHHVALARIERRASSWVVEKDRDFAKGLRLHLDDFFSLLFLENWDDLSVKPRFYKGGRASYVTGNILDWIAIGWVSTRQFKSNVRKAQ